MSLLKRIEEGQTSEPATSSSRSSTSGGDSGSSRLGGISARRSSPPGGSRDTYHDLKSRVQNKLLAELDPTMDVSQTAEVRQTIEELFENILAEEKIVLSRPERRRLFEQIVAEILGLGPLEPLLADETITEVMVNGAKNIYIERNGKLLREPASFESDDHLMRIIDRIVAPLGRRIDESSP
ncbi:MAG: CpaF family protein, partial [Anaerolineales bacterium]